MSVPSSTSLEQMGSDRCTNLSPAERLLLQKAPAGVTAFCGAEEDEDDPSLPGLEANNPAKAANWGPERHVRAELIRWLCVDRTAAAAVDPRGIKLCAAKLTGKLDLSYVTIAFPLSFDRCTFDEDAEFSYLKPPGLSFTGSHMKAVTADGANVAGDLSLDEGFVSEGGVRMLTAQIGANLECKGGTFHNRTGQNRTEHALWADRVKITGSAFLARFAEPRTDFQAVGTVRLVGAQIGGVLDCTGGGFLQTGTQ